MDDLISRKALLSAYDNAHKGPPGNARRLIEEAPAVISDYDDVGDFDLSFAVEALKRAEKKKVKDYDYALPIYDTNGCQNDVLFMYRAKCPKCSYLILDGDFQKFDANDLEINFCIRCGQALDWSST